MPNGYSPIYIRLAAIALLGASCGCRFLYQGRPATDIEPHLLELQQMTEAPQARLDPMGTDPDQPLGILRQPRAIPGPNQVRLTIDQAISKALINSPQIRLASIEVGITRQAIVANEAQLDPTLFGRSNIEQSNMPQASVYEIGRSTVRTLESGVRQKIPTGAEYSLTYALTRNWDDLWYHGNQTRFTPVLAFQLRQPLLRDSGRAVTLAGVDIAQLNHQIALLAFKQKADQIATEVMTAYWRLAQARLDLQIQQELLQMAQETLQKVEARVGIDATHIQVQQARFSLQTRQAQLVQAQRLVKDSQDRLVRLMADPQMDLIGEYQILPDGPSEPNIQPPSLEQVLGLAVKGNPILQQARLAIRVAEINCQVAKNQARLKLDLIASASTAALRDSILQANEDLIQAGHNSYAVGLVLEYPLGNRSRKAEMAKAELEKNKAVANLQDLADQVAVQARDNYRKVLTALQELAAQTEAVEAARIQLQAIADSEPIRDRLTPEFLLVKLQAQEALADSQRAKIRALTEYNLALAELAQITGTALGLYEVQWPQP